LNALNLSLQNFIHVEKNSPIFVRSDFASLKILESATELPILFNKFVELAGMLFWTVDNMFVLLVRGKF
jgi:hypothetical protein